MKKEYMSFEEYDAMIRSESWNIFAYVTAKVNYYAIMKGNERLEK